MPSKQIFQEFQLDGQVAVVSGAYGGLGLEMALSLAEQGAKVYGFDLAPEPSGASGLVRLATCAPGTDTAFSAHVQSTSRRLRRWPSGSALR